jgi:NADH dehydrogenase
MAEFHQSPLHRQRVVIIGEGFGGLSAAKSLADAPVDVIVIDRQKRSALSVQIARGSP